MSLIANASSRSSIPTRVGFFFESQAASAGDAAMATGCANPPLPDRLVPVRNRPKTVMVPNVSPVPPHLAKPLAPAGRTCRMRRARRVPEISRAPEGSSCSVSARGPESAACSAPRTESGQDVRSAPVAHRQSWQSSAQAFAELLQNYSCCGIRCLCDAS